jgi:alpha-amylase
MHKRMLSVSCRLESLNDKWHSHESYQRAQDLLWAGQCNCPYWHGVFGGLYLNHLRFANYSRLIEADALLDSLERPHSGEGQFWTWSDVTDFDSDGCDEVLLSTPDYWLCFSPARGGSLLELDFKKIPINLLDTMTRREEAYHQRLRESAKEQVPLGDAIASIHNISVSKEAGLEKKLYVDWYRRASYIDHFFDSHVSLEDFSRCAYEERGDFVKGKYSYALSKSGEPFSLSLSRNGRVIFDGVEFPVLLTKQFQFDRKDGGLISDYQIQNISSAQFDIRFAAESSFALLAGDAPDRFYQFFGKELDDQRLCSIGVVDNTQGVTLVDEWLKVRIEWNWADPTEVWRFPIETISRSECGFERVYQNSVALPVWHLSLSAGESWHQRLKLTVNTI